MTFEVPRCFEYTGAMRQFGDARRRSGYFRAGASSDVPVVIVPVARISRGDVGTMQVTRADDAQGGAARGQGLSAPAQDRVADQWHTIVAEVHVIAADEDRWGTEAAAIDQFLCVVA